MVYPAGNVTSCQQIAGRLIDLGWTRTGDCYPRSVRLRACGGLDSAVGESSLIEADRPHPRPLSQRAREAIRHSAGKELPFWHAAACGRNDFSLFWQTLRGRPAAAEDGGRDPRRKSLRYGYLCIIMVVVRDRPRFAAGTASEEEFLSPLHDKVSHVRPDRISRHDPGSGGPCRRDVSNRQPASGVALTVGRHKRPLARDGGRRDEG